ncbi:MAG: ABC transporter permease [Gammaproteobacteria bacterium]|nr:ABC transporter permease [Gammaproteobacteria bacterium]
MKSTNSLQINMLARHDRNSRFRPISLALPLVAFIVITFLMPLGNMIKESFYDAEVADALPRTIRLLNDWDGVELPAEEVYRAIATEIVVLQENRTIGRIGIRVNRVVSGTRSVWGKTARRIKGIETDDMITAMVGIDERWSDLALWQGIKKAGQRYSAKNYLHAVDLTRGDDGAIVRVDEKQRVYNTLYRRTLYVATAVTLLCLVIGYPIAYAIAHTPPILSKILLLCVLVPFWTSLLARATSWLVLLQSQGVVNDLLVWFGIVPDDGRLSLIRNMTGTLIAMTQNLLPFVVLPTYAVLSSIPPTYMRAAASLGANPVQAFVRVYWPQSLPGAASGCLLVFILSIGFFITPAIVGGTDGQLISNMIDYQINRANNWGLGAAISVIVLLSVLILYVVFDRWVGVDRLKLS